MKILIENILTVTMNRNNDIGIYNISIEDGRFKKISAGKRPSGAYDHVIDGTHRVAIPGLINGHIHADITLARGLGDGLSLYEQDYDSFVSKHNWFKEQLDGEARYYSRLLQYMEAVCGGTTFICDVPFWHDDDDLIRPLKEIGINAAVVLDYRKDFITGQPFDRERYYKTARRLKDSGYIPVVEAPSEEDYDISLLKRLKSWARDLDTYIHMHLAETEWRLDIIKEKYHRTSVEFLNDIGFLDENVIGSHAVYISDNEIDILNNRGTKIVNCPTSEMKIADGIAPVSGLISSGVTVGIGTDGALWNDCSDMFCEMKQLMLLQRAAFGASSISSWDALNTATAGGAAVFGIDKERGSIESGKRADLVVIDLFKPHLIPTYHGNNSNLIQNIVSCCKAADVDKVIIDGKIVVDGGKIVTVNQDEILKRCLEIGIKRFKNLE